MLMDMASPTFEDNVDYRGRGGGGKTRGRGGKISKVGLCMPKLGWRSGRASPMSLLDRFREVVYRLIMLSAISKGTQHSAAAAAACGGGSVRRGYYSQESYNSEALADCIEFIKKSTSRDGGRDSVASADGVHLGPSALPVI